MRRSQLLQTTAGLAIAAAGLSIFFNGVDFPLLLAELKRVSVLSLLVCAGVTILSLQLRAWRWSVMLPVLEGTSRQGLFSHTIIGFMLNNILPVRAGEAARALLVWRQNRYPGTVSIGSIVVERILDTLTYMLFFIIPAFAIPQLALLRPFAWILSGIVGLAALAFTLYARYPRFAAPVGRLVLKISPEGLHGSLRRIGAELTATMAWSFEGRRIAAVAVFSVLLTLCYVVVIIIVARHFMPIDFLQSLLIQAFAALGSAIPLAPGYVGTTHAAVLQSLVLLGVDKEQGRALTIILHAISYIPVTVVGLVYFFRAKISFGDLTNAKKQLET